MNTDINIDQLPFPRLELRWSKTDDGFLCDYLIVISAPDKLDIRSNVDTDTKTIYGAKNIETSMGKTECSGGRYERELLYDADMPTPFRDGCHILRDSAVLKLPAVVTYLGRAQLLG